ncbi:MAG: hypothetical protein HY762_04930 [Planctomycetes bacterium]|nr:hypothetical protein [Planctomycetota bacterium]
MKRVKMVSVLLIVIIIVTVLYNIYSAEDEIDKLPMLKLPEKAGPDRKRDLQLKYHFQNSPKSQMVYKVKHETINKEWVIKLARDKFNIQEGEYSSDEGNSLLGAYHYYRGKEWVLEVKAARPIIELTRFKWTIENEKSNERLPTEEEAKAIAIDFSKKLDIYPQDAVYRGARFMIEKERIIDIGGTKIIQGFETYGGHIILDFDRFLNGYGFWGSVSFHVKVAKGGKVVKVYQSWPELEPFKEYPIIKPEEAFERLINGNGIIWHVRGQDDYIPEGNVYEITFCYYISPGYQEYVHPCYYFKCKDIKGRDFMGMIGAIKDEYIDKTNQDPTNLPVHVK